MRKRSLLIVVFFALTLAARCQQWPQDAVVFKDVYGNYDNSRQSVKWDVAKEAKPSPYEGRSFAGSGAEMAVKVLLRTEIEETLYVVTSAVPKAAGTPYECHSCLAAVGAAVYRSGNGSWKLVVSSPAAYYGGGWGQPPADISVRLCGPKAHCFLVPDDFGGQGYSEASVALLGEARGAIRKLFFHEVKSDNDGAYDPAGVAGPAVRERKSLGLQFLPDYNRNNPFFDFELVGMKERCQKGHCMRTPIEERYHFAGDHYTRLKPPRPDK